MLDDTDCRLWDLINLLIIDTTRWPNLIQIDNLYESQTLELSQDDAR